MYGHFYINGESVKRKSRGEYQDHLSKRIAENQFD